MKDLKKYVIISVVLAAVIAGMTLLRILTQDAEPITLTPNQAIVFVVVSFVVMVIALKKSLFNN